MELRRLRNLTDHLGPLLNEESDGSDGRIRASIAWYWWR